MQLKFGVSIAIFTAACLPVRADFSYTETTRMTGGSMLKMASTFGGKSAKEPIVSTVLIKGDRMAHITKDSVQIIDTNAETITQIYVEEKSYSVMTFAEMKQLMEEMRKRMEEAMKEKDKDKEKKTEMPPMDFKVDIKETGQHRVISGLDARQVLMKLELDMKAPPKEGEPPMMGAMKFDIDMWKSEAVPGAEEIQAFYRRMAAKMDWVPGQSGAMMNRPGMSEGMKKMMQESAKLKGMSLLQVSRIYGAGLPAMPGMPDMGDVGAAVATAAEREAANQARYEATRAASQGMGRMGGITGSAAGAAVGGMLGGFGKKKKEPPPQQAKAQQPPAPAGDSVLMETTTEMSDFSSASVPASKFDIPAGYQKIPSKMQQALEESKKKN